MGFDKADTAAAGVVHDEGPLDRTPQALIDQSGIRALPLFFWRKLRRPLFLLALVLGDLASPAVAFVIAYMLRFGHIPFAPTWHDVIAQSGTQLVLLLTMLSHVFLMRQMGLYRLHKLWLPLDFVMRLLLADGVTVLIFIAGTRGFQPLLLTRILAAYFFLVLLALTIGLKLLARAVVLFMLCFNVGVKKAVIVGNTETAQRLQRAFQHHPQLGYRVIGLLHRGPNELAFPDVPRAAVRQGTATQIFARLLLLWPDVVIIATSARKNDDLLNLVAQCTAHGIDVRLVPEFHEIYSSSIQIDRIGITPMVRLRSLRVPLAAACLKRALDILAALCVLPLFAFVASALRRKARRMSVPLLTTTRRVGMHGRPFDLFAFNAALWKDPESGTRPWAILLPQILNVLKGDMSVVGPRAGDVERTAHYNSWEKRMLAVRPGLMGFTEVNDHVAREDMAGQMAWDIGYLDQQSAAFDLNVILTSIPRIVMRQHRTTEKAG